MSIAWSREADDVFGTHRCALLTVGTGITVAVQDGYADTTGWAD
jgi:hypothetical protein